MNLEGEPYQALDTMVGDPVEVILSKAPVAQVLDSIDGLVVTILYAGELILETK